MIRVAFNGGELSPQVQMRADLDVFQRGCSCVENFDIGQAGGVTRRRGFRRFCQARGKNSRVFDYVYSNAERYLVELSEWGVRVFAPESGELVWEGESPYEAGVMRSIRSFQVNALLVFVCASVPPHELSCNSDGVWSFKPYAFKKQAWRHTALRDWPVVVTRDNENDCHVEFPEQAAQAEKTVLNGELLRVSYYTEAEEIKRLRADIFSCVKGAYAEGFLSKNVVIEEGTVFAVRRAPLRVAYTVLEAWKGSEKFVEGLIDPANYKSDFQESTQVPGADAKVVSELTKTDSYTKGQVFWFDAGYWDVFTCVHRFDGSLHFIGGDNPEDYPGHFVRGVMLGAAPCKGKWKLHLSGTWYGSYEVRACYEGSGDAADDWEYRAEAWSRNAAPTNEPVAGDEGGEECYISLWLTRVRAYGDSLTERCFPADSCGNELVVSSYKHDMELESIAKMVEVSPGTAKRMEVNMRFDDGNPDLSFVNQSISLLLEKPGDGHFIRVSLPYDMRLWPERIKTQTNGLYTAKIEQPYLEVLDNPTYWRLTVFFPLTGAASNALNYIFEPVMQYHCMSISWMEGERYGELPEMAPGENWFKRCEKIQPRFSGELESYDWSWMAWCGKYGYPQQVSMFNQRLLLAGTVAQPLTIWMSQTDDLDNFAITDEASSGMNLTVNAPTQDPIRWLAVQGGRIMLGTSEGEYVAQSGDATVMTNSNAVIASHGFVGASSVSALRGSDRIIYFERGGGRAMQYGYDQTQDAYISTDLTVYAEHVLADGGGVLEGTFLRKPDSKAVMVLANGQLALMTYNAYHRVNAWHRYVTEGKFLSVTMLPNGDRPDSLFAVVERADGWWIEVCDERSEYVDADGLDYTSTLLTNALAVTSLGNAKLSNPELWVFLHEPCEVNGVRLTVDGGRTWTRVPRHDDEVLDKGWHKLVGVGNLGMERCVGFRCSGNQGMSVGAIQA